MPIGDVLPEIALVLGTAACLVLAMMVPHRLAGLGAVLALATISVAAALTILRAVVEPQKLTFFGTWAVDGVATAGTLLVLATTALVVVLSPEWMRTDRRHGEYYALLLFGALGAIMLVAATDVMELVLGALLSSITGYGLAAYHRASPLSLEAGMKYFLVGAVANTSLVVGVVFLFALVGTTLYSGVATGLDGSGALALAVVLALIVAGLAFKAGAVPGHPWVPDVSQSSPVPSAAFLTVVPKIGGVIALARLVSLFPEGEVGWRPVVAAVAAITMTVGTLAAFFQEDVRRLLGWSAVGQAGFALMAVVAVDASSLAIPALVYFLAAYAVANVCAFAVVAELRGRTAISDYRGLAAGRPWLAGIMTLALLSLVGIPPLAGFVGKLLLFTATIDAGYAWLAVIGVANTVASLFFYLRVVAPMYFERAPSGAPAPLLGRAAGVVVVVTGLLIVGLALGAEPIVGKLEAARMLPT